MTPEAKTALKELSALPNGRSHLGFGPPSALTRELIAEDCIELHSHASESASDDGSRVLEFREHWFATLTARGFKLSRAGAT